jgi:uncharacterized NAD(P)/FAD-binding protein YdhS
MRTDPIKQLARRAELVRDAAIRNAATEADEAIQELQDVFDGLEDAEHVMYGVLVDLEQRGILAHDVFERELARFLPEMAEAMEATTV